ncbi:helix-turn-helix domain-containing protein [Streptomyces sp. NPDC048462]|uniref:helix-turn-helix domain-containing protein n=1 Tax=Streptomyces sp. NPDC048462 TaxID=3365555 RepID=UPI003717AAB2
MLSFSPASRSAATCTARMSASGPGWIGRMARMAVTLLDPVLAAPDRRDLMETLTAWLESDSGSTSEIAEVLYCHRNTVRNRLDRVSRLTGRSLLRPADAAALYAAVRALALRPR